MYEKHYEIHTYEVDAYKRLTLPAMLQYFQDVMMHNADSYGAGSEYHLAHDVIWVLVDYEIDVFMYPKVKDTIIAKTIPYSFKRYYGYRIWELSLEDGSIIATGKAKFILVNVKTKQIATPTKEMLSLFKDALKEPTALSFTPNRMSKPPYDSTMTRIVEPTDIDLNHHMNNIEYVRKAYNMLPYHILKEKTVSHLRITYKKETTIDDLLTIYTKRSNDNFECIFKVDDTVCCIIKMKLEKKHQ